MGGFAKKEDAVRRSFLLNKKLIRALKLVAFYEKVTQTELIEKIMADHIDSWSKQHPDIKFPEE